MFACPLVLLPSCCVVFVASLSIGQDADRGSVSFVGPGCRRFLGSVDSTGLERVYLAFLQPKSVLPCQGTGHGVLQLPHHQLEQKPDVLTVWRPPIARTAARNDNKASRGNGK